MSERTDQDGFRERISVRPVDPGYQALIHYGDGTARGFWGATHDRARAKAERAWYDD